MSVCRAILPLHNPLIPFIMTEEKFNALVEEQFDLTDRMCDEVENFVKAHGGLVRTDNTKNKSKDTIYGIVFSEFDNRNVEFRILAVAMIDDTLCILPEYSDNISIEGMTDEEVLAEDSWEPVIFGDTYPTPTLLSLCEGIWQYA